MINFMEVRMNKRSEWFYRAGWGVCIHFLAIPASTSDSTGLSSSSWNRRVETFNVPRLAAQLAEAGAGYLIITVGQNSGYYCSPNSCYDRIVGPGFCSERDLPAELSAELAKYNIRLLTYLPSNSPAGDVHAMRALDSIPPWDFSKWGAMNPAALAAYASSDSRMRRFQTYWEEIIREWSLRWNRGVSGWWFDGCYFGDKMYDFSDAPNYSSFAAAARSGNPDAIVAYNSGVKYPPVQISDEEDYTAGEINDPWQIPSDCGQQDYPARYHVLSFAGKFWGTGPLRYSPGELAAITAKIMNRDGVVSWDIPFCHADGTIRSEDLEVLKNFSRLLPASRDILPLPDAELEAVQTPLRVWPGNHLQSGQGLLRINNSASVPRSWEIGGQSFPLKPGETHELEVTLPSTAGNGNSIYYLECGEYRRSFPVEPNTEVRLSSTPAPMPEVRVEDVLVGRLELGSDNQALLIRGEVFDERVFQSDIPWMGSCIELFFVVNGVVRQYFLVPAAGNKPDSVRVMPDYREEGKIMFMTIPGEKGYTFETAIPLELTGEEPGGIRMEAKINVNNSHGFMFGQLFGVSRLNHAGCYKGRLVF